MEIISFEDAKTRKQSKERKQSKSRKQSKQKVTEHLSETDDRGSELQRQYQNNAHFITNGITTM